jgi:hypothetical protein
MRESTRGFTRVISGRLFLVETTRHIRTFGRRRKKLDDFFLTRFGRDSSGTGGTGIL